MSNYRIGATLKAMFHTYREMSRRTGRTTRMLENVRPGCLIICDNSKETERLKRLLRDDGKQADVVTATNIQRIDRVLLGRSYNQVMFDHTWVEKFYVNAIESADRELREIETSITRKQPENVDLRSEYETHFFRDFSK